MSSLAEYSEDQLLSWFGEILLRQELTARDIEDMRTINDEIERRENATK